MQHTHIGLVMIRVHPMHRKGAGVCILLVMRNTRWGSNPTDIISSMEIDLERGTELVYFIPDMMVFVVHFYHHIQIVIQTKGYEEWVGGESNLQLTRQTVGDSPTPTMQPSDILLPT